MMSTSPAPAAGPETARKTAACPACRKQKIRCDLPDGKAPCVRCRKKRLPCAVAGAHAEKPHHDETVWRQDIEHRIQQIEAQLRSLPADQANHIIRTLDTATTTTASHHVTPTTVLSTTHSSAPPPGWRLVVDLDSSPGSLPGLRLNTSSHTLLDPPAPDIDIVSQGVVTLANAERYHAVYRDRLDHFPYGILGDRASSTFSQLQRLSPILSTAVCAVGALHAASTDYAALHQAFVNLVATTSFSPRHTADDVRALCIGAFWISDLSASLSSLAVRIATELQLHRSLTRALAGDYRSYLHARLYFLVYSCDHHLSIPHGRPPMTRECDAIRNVRRLLDCEFASHDDARIVSHVSRWTVWTEIFDSLDQNDDNHDSNDNIRPSDHAGVRNTDTHSTVQSSSSSSSSSARARDDLKTIKRLSIKLDTLRMESSDKLGSDTHVGNYPWKGASMQHHFAKLYLCSHVFRRRDMGGDSNPKPNNNSNTTTTTTTTTAVSDVDVDVYELASSAVLAATCILKTINTDGEVRSFLNGLPTYFHVMIAFAVVFLLRMSSASMQFSRFCRVDVSEIKVLLVETVAVLRGVTRDMHRQHLLVSITESAADAVRRRFPDGGGGGGGVGVPVSSGEVDGNSRPQSAQKNQQQEQALRDGHGLHRRSWDGQHEAEDENSIMTDDMLDGFFNAYDFLLDHTQ